jgi:TolA-binding protein/uncharacterized membrane protein
MISIEQIKLKWTKNAALIIDISLLVLTIVFLLSYFQPRYLFLNTITSGGDTASHYYTAQYLRDHLIPHGRVSGWTQGNYAGFPILQFYFPFPFLLIVLLSYFMPLQIAFKLITVLGIFLLPVCTYFALRFMGYLFPVPVIGSLFILPFLFMEANSMWGGNIPSTLAGEFSFSFGLSLTIFFLGYLYRGVHDGKNVIRNGLLVFLIGFSHGYTLLFAGLASSFFLWTTQNFLKKFLYLVKVYLLGFLLLGFWLIPLLSYLPYTTAYNFLWIFNSILEVFPKILWPFFALAIIGTIVELYQVVKQKQFDMPFYYLWYWVLISVACYFSAFKLGIVDIRFLPFLQIALVLLAVLGLHKLMSRFQGQLLLPAIIFVSVVFWVNHHVESIPSWIAWNYSGFEQKSVWPQFSQVNQLLRGTPNDPRVMYEHSGLHNAAGTERAFESLPLFSGRSTLEGVYMQASISAPFIFNVQSEMSKETSCPFPDYACSRHNVERGIKHLEMFNVKDVIVISDEVKSELKKNPKFKLKKSLPPYEVYELLTKPNNQYVELLKYEPVFLKTKKWKLASYEWFKDFKNNDVHLVFPIGTDRNDLRRFKTVISEERGDLPRIAVEGKGKIREKITDTEVEFDTPLINKPHLIKISYHPNWKVEGADKIYLVSPSFMLVYPNQSHVRLYYGQSRPEYVGMTFTLLGLFAIFFKIPFLKKSTSWRYSGNMGLTRFFLNDGGFMKLNAFFSRLSQFMSGKSQFLVTAAFISVVLLVTGFILLGKKEDPQSLLRDGILLKDKKDFVKARNNFKTILDKYPTSPPADQAAYYYAITYYMENNCNQTISGFQHLVRAYSESVWVPEAYYHIGLCNRNLDNKEEANKNFKYVVDNFPTTNWAQYSKERLGEKTPSIGAEALFGQAINDFNHDQCASVKEYVEQIMERHPGFGKMDQALAIYALCFYKEKEFEETINAYNQLIKKYPKSNLVPEAYYHIALSNKSLKRTAKAKENYQVVVEKYPQTEWARYSRDGLKELK